MRYLFLVSLFLVSVDSFAHSGRTDKEGCHNDRKKGEYHCHP